MKKYTHYLAISATALLLAGCTDFLDTVPDNRTELNTEQKITRLVTASYPRCGFAVMFNARVDFVSDKGAGYSENLANTDSFFWRDVGETQQDSPEYLWRHSYGAIAASNHAIEAAKTISGANIEAFVAEAKLTRAFTHLNLVCTFAQMYNPAGPNSSPGIPYVTEPETEVLKMYERSTVAKTYEKIEQDILEGIAKLGGDAKYTTPSYHFTIAAARALATRFYLFKGDYAKVIEHASAVIPMPADFVGNGDTRNVADNDVANVYAKNNFQPWTTTYATAVSSTDIKNYYTKAENRSNLLLTEMSSRLARYANSWRYATKQTDIKSTVDAANPTGGSWAFRNYYSGDSYYLPKFREHFVTSSIDATSGTIYTIFPYFRNEELLLSRAEAFALTDRLDDAINDMNIYTRQRIGKYNQTTHVLNAKKITDYYSYAISSPENHMTKYDAFGSASWSDEKKAVVMFILDCRRNEFMWEGLRYWDMWRYKIPITHTTRSGESNTLYPGDDRWVIQLPETAPMAGLELNPRKNFLSKNW